MTNATRRIAHPIIGTEHTYRADLPPYNAADDTGPGRLILGNGMTVTVLAAFYDWNEVPDLDMLYVRCHETGESTHVTPAELGWTEPLTVAWPDCGHRYAADDPRLERDDCTLCFDAFHSFADALTRTGR